MSLNNLTQQKINLKIFKAIDRINDTLTNRLNPNTFQSPSLKTPLTIYEKHSDEPQPSITLDDQEGKQEIEEKPVSNTIKSNSHLNALPLLFINSTPPCQCSSPKDSSHNFNYNAAFDAASAYAGDSSISSPNHSIINPPNQSSNNNKVSNNKIDNNKISNNKIANNNNNNTNNTNNNTNNTKNNISNNNISNNNISNNNTSNLQSPTSNHSLIQDPQLYDLFKQQKKKIRDLSFLLTSYKIATLDVLEDCSRCLNVFPRNYNNTLKCLCNLEGVVYCNNKICLKCFQTNKTCVSCEKFHKSISIYNGVTNNIIDCSSSTKL